MELVFYLENNYYILYHCYVLQLSSSSDMPGNAVQVLDVLIQYLVVEHIDYAVELGLQGTDL